MFFEHQRDPVANQLAQFPAREFPAFMTHWKKIIADPNVLKRTILVDGVVAGNVLCYEQSGQRFVGYWIGRNFWGKGVATQAVSDLISTVSTRPLHAYVSSNHAASIRVLEKCGFKLSNENQVTTWAIKEVADELLYSLPQEQHCPESKAV